MALRFEWDLDKAARNASKHGVTFPEAAFVLHDPLSITVPDPAHSVDEPRFATIRRSRAGRLLVVVHAEQADTIRLISARFATARERRSYEQGS